MKRPLRLLLLVLVLGAGIVIWQKQERQTDTGVTGLALEAILTDDDAGFSAADGNWHFRFPDDHGGHPGFRSEIWYLTGNLEDEEGHRFGFQLAFFRLRLKPEETVRASAWGANQVFRAHVALTDAAQGRFHAAERFSRAALGLSGMDQSPVRVWLEDWSLGFSEGQAGQETLHLLAVSGALDLKLDLRSEKPPVLPQEADLLDAGSGRGFHLYLMSRLSAAGSLGLDGSVRRVRGYAWLDRAWGAVPMSRGQVALNRFALQLGDGRDILCLQLRRRDGSGTPIPSCLLIRSDGSTRSFRRREIRLEPSSEWRSPSDGTSYPLHWRLALASEELALEIAPLLQDQVLDFAVRSWSGAVEVSGESRGQPAIGRGHMELSGYAGNPGGI